MGPRLLGPGAIMRLLSLAEETHLSTLPEPVGCDGCVDDCDNIPRKHHLSAVFSSREA